MRSSISSSEFGADDRRLARRLILAWFIGFLLSVAVLSGLEIYWRLRGFEPEINDSKQLWSLQRDKVYGVDPLPVVFIGASRTAYGIDTKAWRGRFPETRPVMLSINGHHPLALLRDLARDPGFRGLVICDLNSEGLLRKYREMQQPWVDYYHERWTPSWRLHRLLVSVWQRSSVLASTDLGWKPVLQRWAQGGTAKLPVAKVGSSRNGYARFDRIDDLVGFGKWFEQETRKKMETPPPDPDAFLADLNEVVGWVHDIQRRGGQVVFFQPPVAGGLLALEFEYFDRALYWDAFSAMPGIHTIQGMDLPALRSLQLPDLSHVDAADRPRMTLALAEEVRRMGVIDDRGQLVPEGQIRDHGSMREEYGLAPHRNSDEAPQARLQ